MCPSWLLSGWLPVYGWLDWNERIAFIGQGSTSRHCHQVFWPVLVALVFHIGHLEGKALNRAIGTMGTLFFFGPMYRMHVCNIFLMLSNGEFQG